MADDLKSCGLLKRGELLVIRLQISVLWMIKQAKSPRLALKKMMMVTWGWGLLPVRNLPEHSCNCTASQINMMIIYMSCLLVFNWKLIHFSSLIWNILCIQQVVFLVNYTTNVPFPL